MYGISLTDRNTALLEGIELFEQIGSLIDFSIVELFDFVIELIDIFDIVDLLSRLVHFSIYLIVFGELVEVELMFTEII